MRKVHNEHFTFYILSCLIVCAFLVLLLFNHIAKISDILLFPKYYQKKMQTPLYIFVC